MADTQTTFYIVGIVFMIFTMVVFLGLLITVMAIAARIKATQRKLKNKFEMMAMFTRKGRGFMEGFRRGMSQ